MENRRGRDHFEHNSVWNSEEEDCTGLESIRLSNGDLITLVVRESIDKMKKSKGSMKNFQDGRDSRICKEIQQNIDTSNIRGSAEQKESKNMGNKTNWNNKICINTCNDNKDRDDTIKGNDRLNMSVRGRNKDLRVGKFIKERSDIRKSRDKDLDSVAEVEIELWDDEEKEKEKETTSRDISLESYDSCDYPIFDEIQQNVNAQKEQRTPELKEALCVKESTIHLTYQGKWNFVLSFKATNVRMTFLRQEKRKISSAVCDKICQPDSKYVYQSYIDCFSSKYMLMRKNHAIVLNPNKYWKSKSSNVVFIKTIYEQKKIMPRKTSISKTIKADTRGFLYLNYKGITFLLNPAHVTLESLKPVSEEEIVQGKLTGENFYNVKSRGTFLGKCKNDLLLFKFDIENVDFEQSWHKTSTGTQSKDPNTYIKYYSCICNRITHCAIPLSTYKYIDPMIKIKYKNKRSVLDGIMPSWMKEEKIKRMNNFCKLNIHAGSRIVELNYGSFIQFQTDGNLFCKAKTGVHDTHVVEGDKLYETMIMKSQRQESHIRRREKDINLLADSKHTSIEVLDCDIISNSL